MISLRQSQSASVKDPSVLSHPVIDGIMSDCYTPVMYQSGVSTKLHHREEDDSTSAKRIDNQTASPGKVANRDKQFGRGAGIE